jgi:maleylpyruvate isomerase
MRPAKEIEACVAAHRRLLDSVDRLTEAQVSQPSLLPGWSRGHVITHLARNADSHVWLFEGAEVGEVRRQYPTTDTREANIEAGARRPAGELREDLTRSCGRLEAAWRELRDELWDQEGVVKAGARSMKELVFRRLREVEVHHVDLDLGYSPSGWPSIYVEEELRRRLRTLPDRARHAALVTWLLGRAAPPELAPW